MPSKDDEEPLNLLALGQFSRNLLVGFTDRRCHVDGGGVRGVSELIILDEIMMAIKERDNLDYLPRPCDYFHLMGGTSTGGFVF